MDSALLRASIEANASFEFARSGGPGGQNVNKVNSKVQARVPLAALAGLSEAELARATRLLAGRITQAGELLVSVEEERDQARNREIAIERLFALLAGAAALPKPRKPTKPGRAARERRLGEKRERSEVKRGRASRPGED